jgi:hydroxymethylbilane synthase
VLAALTDRVDPRDVLISRSGNDLDDLPAGARIGTSSPRRTAQLAHYRPGLAFAPIRGNVDTRLRKLQEQQYDAIVLAGAGLIRLGMQSQVTQRLPVEICVPAPGQGILAVQTREDAAEVIRLVQAVASDDSLICATAERSALHCLGGGCQTPAGFLGTVVGDECTLRGAVADPAGQDCLRAILSGPRTQAADLGKCLAEQLLLAGADRWSLPTA